MRAEAAVARRRSAARFATSDASAAAEERRRRCRTAIPGRLGLIRAAWLRPSSPAHQRRREDRQPEQQAAAVPHGRRSPMRVIAAAAAKGGVNAGSARQRARTTPDRFLHRSAASRRQHRPSDMTSSSIDRRTDFRLHQPVDQLPPCARQQVVARRTAAATRPAARPPRKYRPPRTSPTAMPSSQDQE